MYGLCDAAADKPREKQSAGAIEQREMPAKKKNKQRMRDFGAEEERNIDEPSKTRLG